MSAIRLTSWPRCRAMRCSWCMALPLPPRSLTRRRCASCAAPAPGPATRAGAAPGIITAAAAMVGFEELLSRSDIISVHARATPDNRHLFGAGAFARMPQGAFFINTARESLVDEDALLRALASGALAGAALDVAERRPAGDRHPLLDMPNVIITPHIGGATNETLRRGAEMAAAAGGPPPSGKVPERPPNPEVLARAEAGGAGRVGA